MSRWSSHSSFIPFPGQKKQQEQVSDGRLPQSFQHPNSPRLKTSRSSWSKFPRTGSSFESPEPPSFGQRARLEPWSARFNTIATNSQNTFKQHLQNGQLRMAEVSTFAHALPRKWLAKFSYPRTVTTAHQPQWASLSCWVSVTDASQNYVMLSQCETKDVTFLDNKVRITRGGDGSLFVLEREGSAGRHGTFFFCSVVCLWLQRHSVGLPEEAVSSK